MILDEIMGLNILFITTSIFLGVGLAMDAFSLSIANGLCEPHMYHSKALKIAFVFGFFQFLMPMIGWFVTHTIISYFEILELFIPWVSITILVYIGLSMIFKAYDKNDGIECKPILSNNTLFIQGIATSLDALSLGLTMATSPFINALMTSLIIAFITFIICLVGVKIGKSSAEKLPFKAEVLGGSILLLIALEILCLDILNIF